MGSVSETQVSYPPNRETRGCLCAMAEGVCVNMCVYVCLPEMEKGVCVGVGHAWLLGAAGVFKAPAQSQAERPMSAGHAQDLKCSRPKTYREERERNSDGKKKNKQRKLETERERVAGAKERGSENAPFQVLHGDCEWHREKERESRVIVID